MKRKILLIIVCILIICGIFLRNGGSKQPDSDSISQQLQNPLEETISRAQVAKMISFAAYTKEECEELERTVTYKDTDENQWYDKYINAMYVLELMVEKDKFRPSDSLTYGEAKEILEKLQLTDYKRLKFDIAEKEKEHAISFSNWLSVYEYICTEIYNYVPEQQDIFVVMAGGDNKEDQWKVVGETETYGSEGIKLTSCLNQTITAIVKDGEILAVKQVADTTISLKNVWIVEGKKQEVSVFINGAFRTFQTENVLAEEISNVVGDLIISNKKITKVSVKPNKISGKVLAATKEYIEIEDYGKVYLEDGYRIYKIYGETESKVSNAVLVGYTVTDFVISNDKISAALIKESPKAENIRVLLKTTGFKDLFHSKVILTSDKAFTITYGKKEKKYKANEKVTIKPSSKLLAEGRLRVETKEQGKITITSIERAYGNPSYRGSIEIATNEQGLTIVNELPLEEYLYSVVPSEMPTSYGKEAMKVQAVCARSYAYNQLLGNQYSEYGAHIDDSTSFQVYNNVQENETSIEAVKDTYGMVLNYDNEVITAYYFSTSCGYTSSANEVWMNNTPIEYLSGKLQVDDQKKKEIDLTDEDTFRDFLINDEYDTYDKEFAWYRWQTKVSLSKLKKTIDANLQKRYNANKKLILTLVNGKYISAPIDTVGTIKNISITKRATGGVATEVIIKGSKNTVKVISEYNIRILLSPSGNDVIRQDDSKVSNMSLLPSAFIILDEIKKDDQLTGYKIRGGGYGHGVGMSQNGVKAMVEDGFAYKDILEHYYSGVTISSIY
ncbi:SpoIID/LytB domain-containing protein [Anaerosporobacter faecicola]|uniref:SpoIID/LytB domain-containing protein n=1 Tax=Anaerosporobacter faecicola TaxID=2718714 RepID=UPI00143C384A|nr:SpoIID/LytB domain-containing protein [Anaerosporobacter faecicola]